jgi:TatA/E family protein of Tat protein translocase
MLSIPHMIVVFVVVLVVFGPQKLPELARGLGKLMAEFRKASTDFKTAFEEEMRDLERQAREVERRKIASGPEAAEAQPAALPVSVEAETAGHAPPDAQAPDTPLGEPVVAPATGSVPRSPEEATEAKTGELSGSVPTGTTHDQQRPA